MDDLDLFPDATPAAPVNDDPFPAPRDGATEWVAEAWRDRPSADALTDPGAEMALLGAVMLDYSLLADACARVGREDLSDPRLATVLDALVAIDGKPGATDRGAVSVPALCNELRRVGQYHAVGGAQFLEELTNRLPTAVHMHSYAALVADLAARRRLRTAGHALAKRAADAHTPVDVVTDRALREVEHAGKGGLKAESQVSVGASLARLAERVGEVEARGLPLPWPMIDRAIRGLRGGKTIYIAAKTSMGKSSLARNLATALAAPSVYYREGDEHFTDAPVPVLFFSLEMPTDENAAQVMASVLQCSGADVERGTVDMDAYCAALRVLKGAPLTFDDATDSAAQMLALARQFVRKHKRAGAKQAVVMVDYLQLCDPFGLQLEKNPTRERMVAVMSREWKRFAVRENVPVVILSQLNRDCADEECPKLNQLRESGSVEQDADVVMFLWGKLPDGGALTQDITCTLAKIRGGPRGVAVPLTFHRASTRFYEATTAALDASIPDNVRPLRPGTQRASNDYDPRFRDTLPDDFYDDAVNDDAQ